MKFASGFSTLLNVSAALILSLLMSACVLNEAVQQSPAKSPGDERLYRNVVLDNGLKVLLVSDRDTSTAAAAVDVAAGANADPDAFPGLAHFLEHMLFLGTENFPEAGAYQTFISNHGGSNNAYTAYENTNYYFDIDQDYLEPALQRFAEFFISPLFTAAYVERERQAVHSEYQAGLQDDGRRGNSVLKASLNQAHPLSRFSTGSLDTLQDSAAQSLQAALLEHFDQYYSANLMTLVVLGRESLDELEAMVRRYFSAVANRQVTTPLSEQPLFADGSLPGILEIAPVRDSRNLSFIFPIAPMHQYYREKPLHYLGNVLGHEGEGSLLALLRMLGWANALSAGGGFSYQDAATFTVNIALTEAGQDHIDEIAALLFQFIDLVRQQGVHAWLFEEQRLMAELSFRFQSEADPRSTVSSLSSRLHQYPAAEVLTAPYTFSHFDSGLIQELLSYLTTENVLLTHTAKSLTTDQQDVWYQNPYSYSAITEDRQAYWQEFPVIEELAIARPNPFIPENLELQARPAESASAAVPNVSLKPSLILDEQGVRVWHRQDDEFMTPRANFFVYALSDDFSASLRNSLLSAFAVSLVNDKLNEFAYPANLAGSYFGLTSRSRGYMLSISGYNDKQELLLESLLQTLSTGAFSEERFEIIRSEFIRSWQNARYQTPYIRLFEELQGLLTDPYWSEQEKIAAAQTISLADVQAFIPGMLQNLRLDILYHGNVLPANAFRMLEVVKKYLHSSADTELPAFGRVLKMPADTRIVQQFALEHDDSAVVIYLQGVDDSLHNEAMMELLGALLATPFYESLRTEQQLGYIVNAGSFPLLDTSGLIMYIESPATDGLTLELSINRFLAVFVDELAAMNTAQFEDIRQGLLNSLQEPLTRLSALSNRYWNDIVQGEYNMDSKLQLAAEIATISQQEVLSYYRQRIIENSASRLVARSSGRKLPVPQALENSHKADILLLPQADQFKQFKASASYYEYR